MSHKMKWLSSSHLQFAELNAPFSISNDRQKLLLFFCLIVQTTQIGPNLGYSLK